MNKKQKFINIALAVFMVLISGYIGYHTGTTKEILFMPDSQTSSTTKLVIRDKKPPVQIDKDVNFDLFWQVWSTVKNEYVEKNISDKDLFYGALEGMVASLKDPYSVFLKPEISKEFSDELSGEFEGIGAEIGIKKDRLTVISPLPGTPAEKSGLKAGDKIYAIDGADTAGMFLDEAVNKIRGKKGTEVTLTVMRDSSKGPKEIKITRDAIKYDSVRWEIKDNDMAYIKVLHYNTDTEEKFSQAVNEVLKKNPKGIILDLRGNPGGFLDAAVKMASVWVEDGIIVTEKYSDTDKKEHNAVGKACLGDIKTVVLINGESASGSEIVAGALKDHGKAVLVGEKTFGKGSVQSLENFEDGSSLKLTVAKWLTPNGTCINEKGVEPDIEIKMTDEDYNNDKDPQMDKAVEILSSKK
ncbi:MAG: S41 family peptidase [bacterium]